MLVFLFILCAGLLGAQTKVDLTQQVKNTLPLANGGAATDLSAFTDGSIIFKATSALAEDNTNLFWDDTANVLKAAAYRTGAADPADAGGFRFGNAEILAWEASPAGSDGQLTFTAGENFTFDNLGNAGVELIVTSTGVANALLGYQIGSAAASGEFLRGNGTNFVSSAIQAGDIPTHASTHQNSGSDEVATATPGANAIPKAGAGGDLAEGWIPTTLNQAYTIDNDADQIALILQGHSTQTNNLLLVQLDSGEDKFVIEGDGNITIDVADKSAPNIDIKGDITNALDLGITAYGGNPAGMRFRRAVGTESSPTAVQSGSAVGFVGAHAYDGTSFPSSFNAGFQFITAEIQSGTNQGVYLDIFATPAGSTVAAGRTAPLRVGFASGASGRSTVTSTGVTVPPQESTEPENCTSSIYGAVYYDTDDNRNCICMNDGTDDEWLMHDDSAHATGHCSI